MEFHQIKYFLALVRERNFTRAAEFCGVSQPSITRSIRKLEHELGGPLFDRRKFRQLGLTELGRSMRPYLEQSYESVMTAKDEALTLSQIKKRRLRIGVMCTIGPHRLIGVIGKIPRKSPDLEIVVREDTGEGMLKQLTADDVDIAFAGQPAYPPEIAVQHLYREPYAVAFASGHRFENMQAVPLEELTNEAYLDRLNCEFMQYFTALHGEWPVDVKVRFKSEREDWIQAMMSAGFGCSIVPASMALAPGLLTRPLVDPVVHRDISILTLRGRPHTTAVKALIRAASGERW